MSANMKGTLLPFPEKDLDEIHHWNYRIVRHRFEETDETQLQVHEVYYSDDKETKIILWSANPISAAGETIEELESDLRHMISAVGKPILEMSDLPTS